MNINLKQLKYGLPVLFVVLFILVKNNNQPSCTITPAISNASNINGSTVDLNWTNGQNSKITYLNVSTSNSVKDDGTFLDTNIANDIVSGQTSYSKSSLKPGTYYWNIVTDGCKQRKVSKISSFTLEATASAKSDLASASCNLSAPLINTPDTKGSDTTFSWTTDPNTEASYINISTSNNTDDQGILENANIANDIVSGKTTYTKEGLSSGTYYWNIANDGCGQRKISELGSFTIQ